MSACYGKAFMADGDARVTARPGVICVAAGVQELAPPAAPEVPQTAVFEAAELLRAACRPIILAGGGARWSGAGEEIRQLARRLCCPVITTLNAKGILNERDPWSLGHARSVRARAVLPHADAMLTVGCRFTEVLTDWRRIPVPRQLVQIDLDADQIGMNHPVAVGIVADARPALAMLRKHLPERPAGQGWGSIWELAREARQPRPEWLIDTLRAELPESTPCSPTPARWATGCRPTGHRSARAGSFIHRTTSPWAGPSPRRSA